VRSPVTVRRQLALLLAAVLLFANLLTTAHAFGEATHSPTEACSLLHHFERSTGPTGGLPACMPIDRAGFVAVGGFLPRASVLSSRSYLSRAPPVIS